MDEMLSLLSGRSQKSALKSPYVFSTLKLEQFQSNEDGSIGKVIVLNATHQIKGLTYRPQETERIMMEEPLFFFDESKGGGTLALENDVIHSFRLFL